MTTSPHRTAPRLRGGFAQAIPLAVLAVALSVMACTGPTTTCKTPITCPEGQACNPAIEKCALICTSLYDGGSNCPSGQSCSASIGDLCSNNGSCTIDAYVCSGPTPADAG